MLHWYHVDINECHDQSNSFCNQKCTNTNGSYLCSCNTGYELLASGHDCLGVHYTYNFFYIIFDLISDINECFDNNGGCSNTCINTEGSYHCKCLEGYQLIDSKNCEGIKNFWWTVFTLYYI